MSETREWPALTVPCSSCDGKGSVTWGHRDGGTRTYRCDNCRWGEVPSAFGKALLEFIGTHSIAINNLDNRLDNLESRLTETHS